MPVKCYTEFGLKFNSIGKKDGRNNFKTIGQGNNVEGKYTEHKK